MLSRECAARGVKPQKVSRIMKKLFTLSNEKQLVHELADLLLDLDIQSNRYQTDVYLYIEDGVGRLDTFVNVGGNSWLDDDHITIYRDKEHLEDYLDWYQTLGEIADTLCMSVPELRDRVHCDLELDDDYSLEDMTYADAYQWIRSGRAGCEIEDLLRSSYNDYLRELYSDYAERAQELLFDASYDDTVEG